MADGTANQDAVVSAQKFHRGDFVHVAKDLGPSMSHFRSDQDAIVIGSYQDQFGGEHEDHDYTVMFCDDGGEHSWYYENQLTLIRHGSEADITALKLKREKVASTQSDIHWIIANWIGFGESIPGPSACALMRLIGITNPWPHGEGWEYAQSWNRTMAALRDVLDTGDLSKINERLLTLGRPVIEPQK